MSAYDFDLFVIGAGSGGVRAARMAASKGVRVAVAEDRYMGGTCVNVGCVPKKLYVYASRYSEEVEHAKGFGWNLGPGKFHWQTLKNNKVTEIERLNGIYESLLGNTGVEVIEGRGKLTGPHSVEVNGREYSAERILLATGGWPSVPDLPGAEHAITSNEIFDLDEFPSRLLIVGGGYIAVEFAGVFNSLGSEVTMINRGDMILRGFDEEVRQFIYEEMQKKGVDIRFKLTVTEIKPAADGGYWVTLSDGQQVQADQVLFATGRHPNSGGIGLEEVGVEVNDKGAVMVDEHLQTSVPSIFALGDLIDRMALTPVALAEGMLLVKKLYQNQADADLSYEMIPTAVFSQPNMASVGLTEEQAIERYQHVAVYVSKFRAMKHTLSGSDEKTLMKLMVDQDSDRVIGIHMVGDDAGEIIQGLAVAMKAGASKAHFDETIGIHPTAAEEFVTMREPTRIHGGR